MALPPISSTGAHLVLVLSEAVLVLVIDPLEPYPQKEKIQFARHRPFHHPVSITSTSTSTSTTVFS